MISKKRIAVGSSSSTVLTQSKLEGFMAADEAENVFADLLY